MVSGVIKKRIRYGFYNGTKANRYRVKKVSELLAYDRPWSEKT